MTDHLVAYEYGTGVVWGCIKALTPEEIRAVSPELDVYATAPLWMSTEQTRSIRERAIHLDEGVLDSVVHRRSLAC